ncbi:MAG TPA: hypothetical protein VJT73_09555, partial [Polyangiaceae bacterium]|nr:hypothetical protein [Polyangiaceae bacterium]
KVDDRRKQQAGLDVAEEGGRLSKLVHRHLSGAVGVGESVEACLPCRAAGKQGLGVNYLAQSVKDVIVFDPTSLLMLHARRERTIRLTSPQTLALECGCEVTV